MLMSLAYLQHYRRSTGAFGLEKAMFNDRDERNF
jgi:hypothetical protein